MKTLAILLALLLCLLPGCAAEAPAQVAATTLPVWQFTSILCEGTPINVTRLVTEEVSCLHDYTLTVSQMKAIEAADLVVISGAGLEAFLDEALTGAEAVIDSSAGVALLEGSCHHHDHGEEAGDDPHDDAEEDHHGHDHETDAHIWLSPANAMVMAENICGGLCEAYPAYAPVFRENLTALLGDLRALDEYGQTALKNLHQRQIITFHDGFAYLAHAYDIEILEAIEEESGAEPSAQELIHLIELVRDHDIPAIFVERSGSGSAASIIVAETGAALGTLDMAMAGDSYFDAMYRNFDTLKEALG